jgi:hypothetical protein
MRNEPQSCFCGPRERELKPGLDIGSLAKWLTTANTDYEPASIRRRLFRSTCMFKIQIKLNRTAFASAK